MLIKENQLNDNSDLLILGRQSKSNSENSLGYNFNYDLYTRDGKKISNYSICENINVYISSPFNNLIMNYIDIALVLKEQGYDIFNLSSNFYFDVCTSAYLNDSDLTLKVRQENIYPSNISICQSGCIYEGTDLDNKRFVCKCDSVLSKNNELNNINGGLFEEVE